MTGIRCHFTFYYDDENGRSKEHTWKDHRIPGVPANNHTFHFAGAKEGFDRAWHVFNVSWVHDEEGFYSQTEPWHLEVALR